MAIKTAVPWAPDYNSSPRLREVTEEEALTHPNLCQADSRGAKPPDCLEMWSFYLPLLKKVIYCGKRKERDFFLITISICSVLSEPNNGSFCGIFIFLLFLYSVCLTGNDLLAGWRSKALTHKVLPEIPWNTQKCASYSEERIIPQCMELIWFQFFLPDGA